MDQRVSQFTSWLENQLKLSVSTIQPLPGDASTRRYFRIFTNQTSYILMDVPSQLESLTAFLLVTQHLQQQQVLVPEIFAQNIQDGFLLITDFGDETLHKQLNSSTADILYRKAIDTLLKIQATDPQTTHQLPTFDHQLMLNEAPLFTEWFIKKQLALTLDSSVAIKLQDAIETIIHVVSQQPFVYCHRDFHSRNLMLDSNKAIGVIDYQDAVKGPVTYDLVSLLRDCYVKWPIDNVYRWVEYYYQQAKHLGLVNCTFKQLMYWFDWTGIQRHMKAIGIFARLNLHYHKPRYLSDIPRSTDYVIEVSAHYPELQALHDLMKLTIKPIVDSHFMKDSDSI